MVAKIISGKSLMGALNYNENKVSKGKAELISLNGYQKDIPKLNFHDKLFRLKDLAARNERTKTNAVHISLNFTVNEKLQKEKLTEIANEYMERIGFGSQPYLIYLHNDAGHPHIHIVSTNIKPTGERISLHNLGRTKSEAARKSIEQTYQLVRAGVQQPKQNKDNLILQKLEYGKTDTKRAITNVLNEVLRLYKFTSLPELNAILNQYNVGADRGAKDSQMYLKNGLVYWILNNKGNKIGVPIKASSIYGTPTLSKLNEKFSENRIARKSLKERVKDRINPILTTKASKSGFSRALQAKGINVVYRENEQGVLYGVTFVDNTLKVVFNGSDLGKAYSAAALSNWFVKATNEQPTFKAPVSNGNLKNDQPIKINQHPEQSFLNDLLSTDYQESLSIPGMSQNKRKKKRRRLTR
ncbi:relaxase/mobilization nuclease domain-containing protein [Pedobacter sp. P351]|uniref:relaxase/mobilization nuclease domain-containing protein n=1 Tax=Pedobacter superstes TaxID=3133441 RepID=UPI0030B3017B